MSARVLVIMLLLTWIAVGCVVVTPSPSPQPTATPIIPPKQPEPARPRIGGRFLGLPDNVLVTFYVRTPTGRKVVWGTRPNGGLWEAIVAVSEGDYVVTAEAEGYVSQPVSYTIHIRGDTAYVVREGQVTDEEAIHLDFHFVPKDSP